MADIQTPLNTPTQYQLKPWEGFTPTYRTHRHDRPFVNGSPVEDNSVDPPAWTIDANCHGLWVVFDRPDAEHKPLAASTCANCPVFDTCLKDALDHEIGVSGDKRATYRAGTTPWDRVRMHLAMPACPGCGDATAPRTIRTGACTTCTRRETLERRAEMEAVA